MPFWKIFFRNTPNNQIVPGHNSIHPNSRVLTPVLQISNLTKNYGRIKAVDDLDLAVEKGNVYGLLGPNGSGKTTILGIVLDIIKTPFGSYQWFGEEPSHKSRKRIGATLETPFFYPYLSAVNNLRIVARIKEKPFEGIEKVLKIVDLYNRRDDKFKTYSLGMKQRLAIAAALIGDPEVLILDEPTNGLDPLGIAEIRNLVNRIANDGMTIILASHMLDEVQKMCTHVAVLRTGKKLFSGSVADALHDKNFVEVSSNNLELLALVLQDFNGILEIKKEGSMLVMKAKKEVTTSEINEYLIGKGIVLSHLSLRKKTLEEQFIEVLKA